jgi:hypothetical protein
VTADVVTADVVSTIEVTADAYDRDDARIQRLMAGTTWVNGCRSWYKTASGRVTNNWPTWTVRYWLDTLRLRPDDMRVTTTRSATPVAVHDVGETSPSTSEAVPAAGPVLGRPIAT